MKQPIYLYNTLSRSKELFVPINEDLVRVYSCGPTVYGEPHIGNFRAFMLADLLKATLVHAGGYKVKHVMNITDVGHLTDDGDQGEDKMEKGARREGKTVREVARTYEENFHAYLKAFNISTFDVTPRATEHIDQQIAMVKQLTDKGFTYVIPNDGIYMDTSKISDYGKLAQLDVEGLSSHHRSEGAMIDSSKKQRITDFALWKFSPESGQRGMERTYDGEYSGALIVGSTIPSEWTGKTRSKDLLSDAEKTTKGFPGWHVECSAMSVEYLGEHFDIHTGGVDHINVHHTNEIAQTECCYGIEKGVNYWLHQQFLNINGGKMSKSKGHDLSVPGVIASGFSPLDIRYFYMTAQYSSFLDYSEEAIISAQKTRKNLAKKLSNYAQNNTITISSSGSLYENLCNAIADDLNTPSALSLLHAGLASCSDQNWYDILLFDKNILKCGLNDLVEQSTITQDIPINIIELAEERLVAKNNKEWQKADALRAEIGSLGWIVKDTSTGFELEQNR